MKETFAEILKNNEKWQKPPTYLCPGTAGAALCDFVMLLGSTKE